MGIGTGVPAAMPVTEGDDHPDLITSKTTANMLMIDMLGVILTASSADPDFEIPSHDAKVFGTPKMSHAAARITEIAESTIEDALNTSLCLGRRKSFQVGQASWVIDTMTSGSIMFAATNKVRKSTLIRTATALDGPIDTLFGKLLVTTSATSGEAVVTSNHLRIKSSDHG